MTDPIEALLGGRSVRRTRILEPYVEQSLEALIGRLFDLHPDPPVTLETGATLYRPDANDREYRVVIASKRPPGMSPVFIAITEWGPSGRVGSHSKVVYEGHDLGQALKAANEMIIKKLAKGYVRLNPASEPQVSKDGVTEGIKKQLDL
jgi:hypothetical protein